MRSSNIRAERALRRLLAANRSRLEPVLPDRWQADLMRDVLARAAGRAPELAAAALAPFVHLLFRFAGAGALVAVGLVLYASLFGPDLDSQAASLIMDHPAGMFPAETLFWS